MRILGYLVIIIVLAIALPYILFDIGNSHVVRLASAVFWVTVLLMWATRKSKKEKTSK